MRANFGRALCAGLGALYMAGAAPLFNFGETGQMLWAWLQSAVAPLAGAVGIDPLYVMSGAGLFAVGGPLALVWKIAGNEVNRIFWFLSGIAGYGVFWWYFLRG